jgi:CBS domain-containing protein
VAFVAPTASLREVVETMLVKGRRAVPVVAGGTVVGIISNGDLVQRGGLGVRLELLRGLAWSDVHAHLEGLAGAATTAADVMTARPETVQVSTPLRRVARRMARRRLKRLPVLDGGGALAGMVSRVDLLRATAGLTRSGEEPPALAAVPDGARVASIMRTDVPAVGPDAPLPEVLRAIVSTRLHKALVLDADRRVLGLVTDGELMDRLSPSLRPGLLRSLMRPLEATAGEAADPAAARHAQARRASELMTTDVPVVTPETPLTQAIATMLEADRKILAVVDGAGRLVGVVDRADLLRGIAALAEAGAAVTGP